MPRSHAALPLFVLLAASAAACNGDDPVPEPTFESDTQTRAREEKSGAPLEPVATDSKTGAPPAGEAPPAPGSAVNTVDTIVDDMRLLNDGALAGVPSGPGWTKGPGHVVMGNDPRGTRTPTWWNPANTKYKSSQPWTIILPWVVVFDGVGNAASNTRVEMRRLQVWAKRKGAAEWTRIHEPLAVDGELYPKTLQGEQTATPDQRESGGVTSVRPPGGNLVFHGWGVKRPIDGTNLECVFITMQARLAVGDASKPDDRAQAKYLIHIGADYYPDAQTSLSAFAPVGYLPGVGVSRAKFVKNDWQAFNFATITGGVEDPGGATMDVEVFRAAPPPLE